MLRKKACIIILAIIAIPLVMGLNASGCSGKGITGVKVDVASSGEISSRVSAMGTLESSGATDVVPIANGTISELMVSDGDEVAAGEVLATLQQGSLNNQAEQAWSSYLTTTSMGDLMSGMWGNSTLPYSALTTSMQSFGALQAQTDSIAMTFFDLAPTFASFLPPQQQQQVLTVIEQQKTQYVENMNNRVTPQIPSPTGYPSSANAADAARTELAKKQYQLAAAGKLDPRLTAPISGAVIFTPPSGLFPSDLLTGLTSSLGGLSGGLAALGGMSSIGGDLTGMLSGLFPSSEIKAGTQVQAGQAIFQIVDLQNMRVKANVEETDIPKVKKGQKVMVMLDAYPDQEFRGTVVQVSAKGQSGSSGTTVFPVTVQMDRSETPLRIGYNAIVDIEVMKKEQVLVISAGALVKSGSDTYVYVVKDGVAVRRDVVLGMEAEDLVEIKEGLEEGEVIVVEGANKVKPGSRI
jgi:multidrug efflux pump subunit AcrA (membrane-fusion protein)